MPADRISDFDRVTREFHRYEISPVPVVSQRPARLVHTTPSFCLCSVRPARFLPPFDLPIEYEYEVPLSYFTALLFLSMLLIAGSAFAQDSQDDQPHITPRNSPTPTPSPTPKPAASQPTPKPSDDQYERPPFPGDVQQKPGANEASPKPSDDKYERPPFPGDAPGTHPTGGSVSGESSSKDSQIDTDSRPAKKSLRLRLKTSPS